MANVDRASLLGLILCIALIIFGIGSGDKGIASIVDFLDPPSAYITFGGAFSSVLIMSPSLKEYWNNLKSFTLILKVLPSNEVETIDSIIKLSNVARKEGY